MKKFILLLGFFYVITFFSFREKNNKPESFADIIKNDSSRVQELLDEAVLLNNARVQQKKTMRVSVPDPDDELNPNELANFRALAPKPDDDDKKSQTIIVSSQAILELIGVSPGVEDSLIFYLGKYPEGDKKRIDRYNKRNNRTGNPHNDYDYNTLGPRITFAIQSRSEFNKTLIMSKVYDVGRLCPPPSTGCF